MSLVQASRPAAGTMQQKHRTSSISARSTQVIPTRCIGVTRIHQSLLHSKNPSIPQQLGGLSWSNRTPRQQPLCALPVDSSSVTAAAEALNSLPIVLGAAAPATAAAAADVPSFEEATNWLLKHPLYVIASGGLALYAIPRVVEGVLRYLLLPALATLTAIAVFAYPADTAAFLGILFDWINTYPEVFSVLTIAAVAIGLLPAILSMAGTSGAVYLLLTFLYAGDPSSATGVQVKFMQKELAEVVQRGQSVVKTVSTLSKFNQLG